MLRGGLFLLFSLLTVSYGFSVEPQIIKFTDGPTLILDERKGSGVCAIQIWVKVGSKYEDESNSGITHFIEHLIFKGSKNLPPGELARRIEAYGGSLNAFTSYDHTVYHVVIPKEAWREGFLLLSEAVLNADFPQSELEKERSVVLEEIKMNEDDPWRKLYQELFSLSYGSHPYGRPILGFAETIRRLTREEIVRYYRSHYLPQRMVIVCVGEFERDEIKRVVEERFGKGFSPSDNYLLKSGLERGKGIRVLKRDVKESYLAVSYPIPSITHEDIPALYVLSAILTDGESSRLQHELKNKKRIVNGISSFVFSPKEGGLIIFSMNFLGRDYERVLKELRDEIYRLRAGIEPWELKKAKNQIMAQTIYSMETSQGRARILGYYYTLTEDVSFLDRFLKRVEEVEEKDVLRVVERYINSESESIVVLMPKDEVDAKNPHSFELKNGLRLVVNEKKDTPSFSIVVGFHGGLKEEPPKKSGLFNLLSRMLLKGTLKRDSKEVSKFVDSLGGEIESFSGYNLFGLTGKFLSKDFEEVLKFFKELLTEAHFTEGELQNVKNQVLSELRMKEDDPSSFTFRKFYEFVFTGHPYGRDVLGRKEDVEGISLEDVRRAYELFVNPKNCVIAISGDVNSRRVYSLAHEVFSHWEGGKRHIREEEVPFRGGFAFFEKDIIQNHLIFGFKGVNLKSGERFAIEVMDAVLSGMGGRIFKALREERPFAYATSFFNVMGFDFGLMGVYVAYDSKNTHDVKKAIEDEIRMIVEVGFTDEEIERAKRYLTGTFLIGMQSNSAIAYRMLVDTALRGEPDFFRRWPREIERVKREDVNSVAKKYLRLDDAAVVTVGRKN